LLFNLEPDPTYRQNASVTVSHPKYETYHAEKRLWEKCENWSIGLKEKQSDAITQSIVILLDASGSMKEDNRMAQAKASARSRLEKITGDTEVALIVFYDCGRIVVEQEFTTDTKSILDILPKIKPSGQTPLAAATKFAKKYLKENARGKRRRLVILTDGKETCGGDPVSAAQE
jgi:Mg-chelatase subunit ChlD